MGRPLTRNYFCLFSAASLSETAVFLCANLPRSISYQSRKAAPYISCQLCSKANQHISYQSRSIATVYLVSIMQPAYLVLLILFQFCSNFVPILCQFCSICFIFFQICANFVPILSQFRSNAGSDRIFSHFLPHVGSKKRSEGRIGFPQNELFFQYPPTPDAQRFHSIVKMRNNSRSAIPAR